MTNMNDTGRNNMWDSFQGQVELLFKVGYKLPEDMYQRAIENIEDRLNLWKAKVTVTMVTYRDSKETRLRGPLVCDNQQRCSRDAESTNVERDNEPSPQCVKYDSHTSDDGQCQPKIILHDIHPNYKSSGSDEEQFENLEAEDDKTGNKDLKTECSVDMVEQVENDCMDTWQIENRVSANNASDSVDPETHADGAKNNKVIEIKSTKGSSRRREQCSQPKRKRLKRTAQLSQNTTCRRTEKDKHIRKKQKSERAGSKLTDKTKSSKRCIQAKKDSAASDGVKSRQCELCFNVYGSESGYRMHMKKHRVSDFPCPHCTYTATSERHLDTHITVQHPQHATDMAPTKQVLRRRKEAEGGDKYSCSKCDRQFSYVEGLHTHMKIHRTGPLKCPECPKEFLSTVGYRAHVKLHTGQVLKCPHCVFVSGNISGLNAHLKRVHEKPKAHLCDICGRGFVTKSRLQQHIEAAHLDDSLKTTYECPHCDHKSHNKSNMTTHITIQHTDVPRFVCNICGVTLKYKASLQEHQMRHTTNKTIPCTDCPFLAICQSDLKRHMNRKHCVPKFKCDVCGKLFKNQFHLVRHEVIHTSHREFSCDRCTYKCNVKGNLSKHMLHIHKIKPQRVRPVIEKINMTQVQQSQPQAAQPVYDTEMAMEDTVTNGAPIVYNIEPYPQDCVTQQQLQYW